MSNEAVLLPFQTPPRGGGFTNDLINPLLHFKPFTSIFLRNLHQDKVQISPFPLQYVLLTFIIYRAYRAPAKSTKEVNGNMERQRKMMPAPKTLHVISFGWKGGGGGWGGITYDWYSTFYGITIPIRVGVEKRFLREQVTYRHNPEFLRYVAIDEIGRMDISIEPCPDDQNDANLGAVTDDDEDRDVTFVNVLQLKGMAQILEPGYKLPSPDSVKNMSLSSN